MRRPPPSPRATATCCSPTRTRRSWPEQNGADVDYVVPDDTLLIENPAAVTEDAGDAAQALPGLPDQPRGAGRLRRVRLPAGRRRCRPPRGRGRQRPGRPVPDAGARCSPSTVTSAAGARPNSTFFDGRRNPASSPSCSSETGRTARSDLRRPHQPIDPAGAPERRPASRRVEPAQHPDARRRPGPGHRDASGSACWCCIPLVRHRRAPPRRAAGTATSPSLTNDADLGRGPADRRPGRCSSP